MVVVLEIEDRSSPKPFLGGWRDLKRNVEYHDAASQTVTAKKIGCDREIQTSGWKNASVEADCGSDKAVQASSPFPQIGDRVVWARNNWTHGEVRCRRKEDEEEAALKIQRFYR
ncbi:hypothetical protein QAD02_014459 [Eretmocerus hayati]|uniref:Uncharacterized protein n=1 Tax=Eretmocerus hayati TaxID=131215 RepID=A0ACC2P895_9HYME|nr:hypothetical protein QAD02_014459 [Eretmocerus hayati]